MSKVQFEAEFVPIMHHVIGFASHREAIQELYLRNLSVTQKYLLTLT